MKRRLFLFLFIASLLLVLGTIAAACGDDDESDEDAIRNVIQELTAASNDRDFDTLAELSTDNFGTAFRTTIMVEPDFRVENLEFLSVMVAGDEATVVITHGGSHQGTDTALLKREDGRWLVDSIK